jgi:hypothetical protein
MSRKRQPTLTVNQIAGIEEVMCNAQMHRVVLLTDGQIAMPDHPRRLMRLEDEMRKKGNENSCPCVAHARALHAGLKTGWTGAPTVAYSNKWTSNGPDNRCSPLFANRAGEIQLTRVNRTSFKAMAGDPLAQPFTTRVLRLADRTFRDVLRQELKARPTEINIREFHSSDLDCQTAMKASAGSAHTHVAGLCQTRGSWQLFFNVLHWYTKIHRRGCSVIDRVFVLKVLQWGMGQPTEIVGLKLTPKGQAATVGIARVTPACRVLFRGAV